MAEQGREGSFQEQVCLSCRFQVIITNSPRTRLNAAIRCLAIEQGIIGLLENSEDVRSPRLESKRW